jgi:choline-sulfatase
LPFPANPLRAALLVGSLAALGCAAEPERTATARHLVVVSLDTTRADYLGAYGNPWVSTPRIDALARESVVFDALKVAAPTTLASHVSLFTGAYPLHHGTPRNGFTVHPDNVMLAEILRDAGFHTAGFVASFALESRFGFAQGFAHYDETFDRLVGDAGADQNQRRADAVTDAAIAYLDALDSGRGVPNLFLFVHYFDPHAPYDAPSPWNARYGPEAERDAPPPDDIGALPGFPPPDPERVRALRRSYAAEISFTDHHVGRLLDALRERGLLDESVVLLTSDHGENLGEHDGRFDHGFHTFETTMRGVAMVRLPGARLGGGHITRVASSVDLLPTLLAQLGLRAPEGLDGVAIDLEAANSRPETPRFGEASKPWERVETDPRWRNARKARCVWDGDLKLMRIPYVGVEALFDLARDPREQDDLLLHPTPDQTAQARRLRALLDAWTESAHPLPSDFDRSQREESARRLRALGYLR